MPAALRLRFGVVHKFVCWLTCHLGSLSSNKVTRLVARAVECKWLPVLPAAQIRQGQNSGFQFKTHPNIDKAGYGNGVLGLKDPSRPFPTGQLNRLAVMIY